MVNKYESGNMFEEGFEKQFHGTQSIFKAINPYFFNFLRKDGAINEDAMPLEGVTISWSAESRLPVVILENFEINEEAQLFFQMYGDQLVEV